MILVIIFSSYKNFNRSRTKYVHLLFIFNKNVFPQLARMIDKELASDK